jgi:hypothetical protein
MVRAWGFGYVLLGLGTAVRMGMFLLGKAAPQWPAHYPRVL